MNDRRLLRLVVVALRVSLAASFLSAVGDRFGLWGPAGSGNVAWGSFDAFLDYTGQLFYYLPPAVIPVLGWLATVGEMVLAAGLLLGWRLRWFAIGSGLMLASFALAMTIAQGAELALSYSVWTSSAAAFMLAFVVVEKSVPD
ncbi:DoxX family protein [Luteolibacter marinus]|uniref:DoxX family protein n=1 Tax=Luteolibacter marinus TaxID=2776705 RepID=UPI0018683FED|nr:DoxX family protein [Luteolibacter marinus]